MLGLLVAGIPLLVHLLRHRRVKQVRFSTLDFLKLLHKKHSLRIRVSQLLLLLARIALASGLTLLFAQPFFTSQSLQFLNGGPRQVVALFDNSGSMGLKAREGRTMQQAAVDALRSLAAGLSPREALTVIALSPRARVTFRGRPEDFGADGVPAPSAAAVDVEGGERLARAAFEERPGSERQLAVLSDFVRFPVGQLARLDCEVLLFPFRADNVGNRAAGPITVDADKLVAGEAATFRLSVGRYGVPSQTRLTLSVADKPADTRFFPAGLGPAQVVFTARFEKPGVFPVSVSAEPDALPGDDRAHTVVEVLAQRRVAIVTGRALPPAEGARDPLFFLRRAFAGASLDVTEAPEKLEGTSLVVLLRPDLLSTSQGRAVAEHVRRGGNVLTFLPPDELDSGASNRNWFEALGLLRVGRKVEAAAPWRATSARAPGGLVESRYWEAIASSARFLLEPAASFRRECVLVAFDDGTPALYSGACDRGWCTVINAGATLEGADLPLHPIFPIFLSRLLTWSPERLATYTAGDEVSFNLPVEEFGGQFQIVAPGNKVHALTPERRGKQLVVNFAETAEPGLYRFERVSAGQRSSQWFVVRWPESESTLEFPTVPELMRQLPRARLGSSASGAVWTGRLPFSVQDLLLSFVVLLILAETWLVFDLERQISRDLPEMPHG